MKFVRLYYVFFALVEDFSLKTKITKIHLGEILAIRLTANLGFSGLSHREVESICIQ